MLHLCRRYGIEQPDVNAELEGHEVDFSWPHRRLIVETDGWQAHGIRAAFERDRLRDAELTAAGWRVSGSPGGASRTSPRPWRPN
jgi:hypothetical protein